MTGSERGRRAVRPLAAVRGAELRHSRIQFRENPVRVLEPDPGVESPQTELFVPVPLVVISGEAFGRRWRFRYGNRVFHGYQPQLIAIAISSGIDQQFGPLRIEFAVEQG